MGENKRIAKNSLYLYGRLIISTLIGLYTSRIVLHELGASDFGLYAVVGGIVVMMNFLSNAMLAVSFRYMAYEIGKGENGDPNKIFNIALIIHFGLALLLLIAAETIGIYYINNYLNIASDKISDAIFVLRFSVFASVFSVISIPFQGVINANEKFSVNAVIGILQSILRLIVAVLLISYLGNKLRYYAVLMFISTAIPSLLYGTYCFRNFNEIIKWKFISKKSDYLEMFSYTAWITLGAIASLGVRQGYALIINLFFGTVLNATYGIALQVSNYVMTFVRSLNQATVPQITKSHSSGDTDRGLQLVYHISKYAFFLMLLPAIPITLYIDTILKLWLVDVPEFTNSFVVLLIINGLIACTSSGYDAAIQATGKIKKTQLYYSIIQLLSLPAAYLVYVAGYSPEFIIIILIIATIINLIVQTRIMTELTAFKLNQYFNLTIKKVLVITFLNLPQYFLRMIFPNNLSGLIVFTIISIIFTFLTIYFFGLTVSEKAAITNQFKKYFQK